MKKNFLAIVLFHCLSGLVCWLAGSVSAHCTSDCCSVHHMHVRLWVSLCCGLVHLYYVVVGMQVDRLCSLEEFFVAFCDSAGSVEVVGCLQCSCVLGFMNAMHLCLWCVSG